LSSRRSSRKRKGGEGWSENRLAVSSSTKFQIANTGHRWFSNRHRVLAVHASSGHFDVHNGAHAALDVGSFYILAVSLRSPRWQGRWHAGTKEERWRSGGNGKTEDGRMQEISDAQSRPTLCLLRDAQAVLSLPFFRGSCRSNANACAVRQVG